MKILLILAAAFACAALATAADPVVVVVSATSVTVDGVNFGKPADTIANNPQLASAIQLALEKYDADRSAALAAAEAKVTAAEAKRAAVVTAMEAAATQTTLAAKVAAFQASIAVAKQTDAQKRLAEITAQKAALDAEAAKLATP